MTSHRHSSNRESGDRVSKKARRATKKRRSGTSLAFGGLLMLTLVMGPASASSNVDFNSSQALTASPARATVNAASFDMPALSNRVLPAAYVDQPSSSQLAANILDDDGALSDDYMDLCGCDDVVAPDSFNAYLPMQDRATWSTWSESEVNGNENLAANTPTTTDRPVVLRQDYKVVVATFGANGEWTTYVVPVTKFSVWVPNRNANTSGNGHTNFSKMRAPGAGNMQAAASAALPSVASASSATTAAAWNRLAKVDKFKLSSREANLANNLGG